MPGTPKVKDILEVGDRVYIHYLKTPPKGTKNEKYHKQEGEVIEVKEYVDPPGPSHIYIVKLDNDDEVDLARHECVWLDQGED